MCHITIAETLQEILRFTSSHLHIINRIDFMRIWRAVRGEDSEHPPDRLGQE